jgi:FkbM family methyltransferase
MYDQFRWTKASEQRNRLTREYEPLQPYFLMAMAEEARCKTFIDVGANVGLYSLFSTTVPSVDRVIAFEANPKTLEELGRNVALNDLSGKVEASGRAVSREVGTTTFGVISNLSGANSVLDTSIHDASAFRGRIEVETVTLDHFLEQDPMPPFCFKIDVEGHEAEVLAGGRATLGNYPALIQIEDYGDKGGSSFSSLKRLGYSLLTAIGPDHYFSNIEHLADPATLVRAYERAAEALIRHNHADKGLALGFGDFRVLLTGRSSTAVRALAGRVRSAAGRSKG